MERGLISNDVLKITCYIIVAIALVAAIVLIILGFSSLEATEYGLDYSWISKTV
jgi:hypothetical protein